jgi:hypothetical protein
MDVHFLFNNTSGLNYTNFEKDLIKWCSQSALNCSLEFTITIHETEIKMAEMVKMVKMVKIISTWTGPQTIILNVKGKTIIKFEEIYPKNLWILYPLLYILHLKNSKYTQVFTCQISKKKFYLFFPFDLDNVKYKLKYYH